jgi:biotin carboxylase
MSKFIKNPKRNTVLFVNDPTRKDLANLTQAVSRLSEELDRSLNVLIITDRRVKSKSLVKLPFNFERIVCDTRSVKQIEKALLPYHEKLLLVTGWHDKNMPYFQRIIPHVPYLHAPTVESLEWATDKIMMRRRLRTFNRKTSPAYMIVEDVTDETIAKIKKVVGFPLIVKPAGLAASVLVSVCFHEDELKKDLAKNLKKLKSVYKKAGGRGKPAIIVEQYMDGRMYSTDIYVDSRGSLYATPLVNIVTGYSVGMNDFFGYKRFLPVTLNEKAQENGIAVAKEATHALALRSTVAHVELLYTDEGWKIIEAGPRMGGFRHEMYEQVYGINHALNDLKIRLPMAPKIPKKPKGVVCVMQFYAKEEGIIKQFRGINKVRALESVKSVEMKKSIGDKAMFARNGGGAVMVINLFNKNRSSLLADIRRLEQNLKIDIQKRKHEFTPEIVYEVTDEIIKDQVEVIEE